MEDNAYKGGTGRLLTGTINRVATTPRLEVAMAAWYVKNECHCPMSLSKKTINENQKTVARLY